MLRRLLAGYLGLDMGLIQFQFGNHGKPRLGGNMVGKDLQFNLAQSADMALAGFCRGKDIGIDIEQIRPMPDLEQISSKFFSAHEQDQLGDLPEERKLEGFFTCWTCKEAFIKNLGEGLSYPLSEFDVDFNPKKPTRIANVRSNPQETPNWQLTCFPVENDYIGAMAVRNMDLCQVQYFSAQV